MTPAACDASPPRPAVRRPVPRRPFSYRGVRQRSWGSWVAEIRVPHTRHRLWLGSYPSARQAARAYDVASACLRGPAAPLNLPSLPLPPPTGSLSPSAIRDLAAQEAASFPLHHHDEEEEEEEAATAAPMAQAPSCVNPSNYANEYDPLLQQQIPADGHASSILYPNITARDHCVPEFNDLYNLSSPDQQQPLHCELMQHGMQEGFYSQGAVQQQQISSEVENEQVAAHDQRPPSLLDLWCCLDIGPAVDPSLRTLLAHSLYPRSSPGGHPP